MTAITEEMLKSLQPPNFADENKPASTGNDMSVSDFAGSRCTACDGGVVFLAVVGEHCGDCHPCPRRNVAPWPYCVVSTIPCDCPQGVRVATKAKKLRFPEAANPTVNLRTDRRRWLLSECVFSTAKDCDAFVRECRLMREAAENASGATAMPQSHPQATPHTPLPVDRALRAIAANPTILPTLAEKPSRYDDIPEF
jgi:hypothetical protein